MTTTNRDYASKVWLDPVCEVERDALRRGFRRGAAATVAIILILFVLEEMGSAVLSWWLR